MSVTLTPPSQLGFPRPLTTIVKRSLFIHNPHSSPVAFKVKTTAPKQYCVRPNQGRVESNETIEVHIVLQPLPTDPPPHAKCKDKFLVQSTFIPPDEEIRTLPEMWATVERTNKAAIHEQKIRCAYLAAEDGSGDPNGIPEENEDHLDHSKLDESLYPKLHPRGTRWTISPEPDYSLFPNGGYTVWELESPPVRAWPKLDIFVIMRRRTAVYSAAEASPVPKNLNGNGEHNITSTPIVGAAVGAAGAAALSAPQSPPSPSPAATSRGISQHAQKELPSLTANDVAGIAPTNIALERSLAATTSDSDKLNIALKEIDRLKAQLSEAQGPTVTGLRKRGGASTDVAGTKTQTAVASTAASGVPLEVCAGLVFAVFVLTYLFF